MPKNKGGRKREQSNLELRVKNWVNLPESVKSKTKRPGSNKK